MIHDSRHELKKQNPNTIQGPQGLETTMSGHLRHREWLSALMDGELSELELRGLLAELRQQKNGHTTNSHDEDQKLRQLLASWERYHLVQAALHSEPLSMVDSLSLSDRIASAIESEPLPAGRRISASWHYAAGRLAIAASVALAVFVGMQTLVRTQQGPGDMLAGSGADENGAIDSTRQLAVDEDAQRRLNDYIRSVSIPARVESQSAPYNVLLESPLLRPVADRELVPVPAAGNEAASTSPEENTPVDVVPETVPETVP